MLRHARHDVIEPLISRFARRVQSRLLREYAVYGPAERLHLPPSAVVNDAIFNLASGRIVVGDRVMFGHGVMILTGTHDVTKFGKERQESSPPSGYDVYIDEGTWLGSRVTVVGPCRIGAHAVVGACSLVMKDVAPYTLVAGSPARFIRDIPRSQ